MRKNKILFYLISQFSNRYAPSKIVRFIIFQLLI